MQLGAEIISDFNAQQRIIIRCSERRLLDSQAEPFHAKGIAKTDAQLMKSSPA